MAAPEEAEADGAPRNATLDMMRMNEAWGNICFDKNSAKSFRSYTALSSSHRRSVSGLEAGIKEGPHGVSAEDVMVMVPCRTNDDVSAMFTAWGKEFNDAGSLELFAFSGKESTTQKQTKDSIEEPTLSNKVVLGRAAGASEDGANVLMLVYSGVEGGIKESLSLKVKKHMEYVAHEVAGAGEGEGGRYAGKKWFIKSDTDTFVVTRHLLAVLSNYDPSEPWYIGYQFTKGKYKYVSGGLYAMSREAVARLDARLKGASILRYEDMMIGTELGRAGVVPTVNKGFHWKRPFQREIEWGVVGGLVQVHKIKGEEMMSNLVSWTNYVLYPNKTKSK